MSVPAGPLQQPFTEFPEFECELILPRREHADGGGGHGDGGKPTDGLEQ